MRKIRSKEEWSFRNSKNGSQPWIRQLASENGPLSLTWNLYFRDKFKAEANTFKYVGRSCHFFPQPARCISGLCIVNKTDSATGNLGVWEPSRAILITSSEVFIILNGVLKSHVKNNWLVVLYAVWTISFVFSPPTRRLKDLCPFVAIFWFGFECSVLFFIKVLLWSLSLPQTWNPSASALQVLRL